MFITRDGNAQDPGSNRLVSLSKPIANGTKSAGKNKEIELIATSVPVKTNTM